MLVGLPDDTPFGPELAARVRAALCAQIGRRRLCEIVRSHRDYTGHGLYHDPQSGAFFVSASQDGWPTGEPLISFSCGNAFCDWLAR